MPVFTDSIKIAVDVINQGPEEFSEGMEVVQLYISDPYASISKPVKELKAFKKIRLAYGEQEKVSFTLKKRTLLHLTVTCISGWQRKESIIS